MLRLGSVCHRTHCLRSLQSLSSRSKRSPSTCSVDRYCGPSSAINAARNSFGGRGYASSGVTSGGLVFLRLNFVRTAHPNTTMVTRVKTRRIGPLDMRLLMLETLRCRNTLGSIQIFS